MSEEKNRAKEQARLQLDSIVQMVKRLEHTRECDGGEDCELTDEEIITGLETLFEVGEEASKEERETYHNEDEARQAIEEDPLSVEVRSDWHTAGENSESTEYKICLCTGGPAVQIIGDLDKHSQPETAKLQYQDWFTRWENFSHTTSEEDEALLTYARQFYFGE